MFKLFKTIKNNSAQIVELKNEIAELKNDNAKLVETLVTYNAIGIPFVTDYDKRTRLLIEARNRGYFDEENNFSGIYTSPIKSGIYTSPIKFKDRAYFKHFYSNIASSYEYDEESDSLYIPGIGVKNNFSAGGTCIYKDGVWSKIKKSK